MKAVSILVLGLWSAAFAVQVSAQAPSNELLMRLYDQLQALQSEVQALRGTVEEQAYQLQRMQTEQRDRYIDLDKRLSEMALGAGVGVAPAAVPGQMPADTTNFQPVPATGLAPVAPAPQVAGGVNPGAVIPDQGFTATAPVTNPASSQPAPQMDEQELYRTALNLLLEQGQYDESFGLFQSYIDNYPQGRLFPNALYWQGEALILMSRLSDARDVFTRLMNQFPQDPKAASAMLKLGVVHQQMGNQDLATQTWRDIATRYPESVSEINLARDYLNNRR